jgi:hypothetical protein
MQLLPKSPREWISLTALGAVAFVLGLATNVPAAQWIGFATVVGGLVGWWVTAQIAHRRQGSRAEK